MMPPSAVNAIPSAVTQDLVNASVMGLLPLIARFARSLKTMESVSQRVITRASMLIKKASVNHAIPLVVILVALVQHDLIARAVDD